jgi:Ycf66 protein N-terminus
MLAYVLALMVGSGSFALYMAAFFFPEVHRKNDFVWSGVGLFYALVLWVCAGRITGGVLLGEMASVALLGWLGWQTFLLRRQVAAPDQLTPMPTADEIKAALGNVIKPEGRSQLATQTTRLLTQAKAGVQGAIAKVSSRRSSDLEEPYTPPSLEEFGTAGQDAIDRFAKVAIPENVSGDQAKDAARNLMKDVKQAASKQAETEQPTDIAEAGARTIKTRADQVEDWAADTAQEIEAIAKARPSAADLAGEGSQQTTGAFSSFADGVRSLIPGRGKKKDSKPVYVRKQYRDQPEESTLKSSGKPVYVRKQYRDQPEQPPTKPGSKPVYVRKQYRDEVVEEPVSMAAAELITDGAVALPVVEEPISDLLETKDAIANSLISAVKEDSGIEIVDDPVTSTETMEEAIAPSKPRGNLLDNDRADCTPEEIVEELLESISEQEADADK